MAEFELIPVSIIPIIGKSSSALTILIPCARVTVLNSPGLTVVKAELVALSIISKFSIISWRISGVGLFNSNLSFDSSKLNTINFSSK